MPLWWGAVLLATVIIVAHFWLSPSSPSRSRRAAHTQGKGSVGVPVFCVGGPADVRRALSVLRLALDRHRTELSNRMKFIDGMLSVALPHCVGREEMRHVVEAVRQKEWKELNRTPEAWQVNDDLLHSLLRQPPFVPALSNTAAGVSRHDATDGHGDDDQTTATFTADRYPSKLEGSSSSPDNEPTLLYDEVSQVFVHLQRDWTADGAEIRRKTYGPLLKEVAQHVREQGASILVPGCGLGRLAFELSVSGLDHKVTAVDVSASMVAATHAVLTWPGVEGVVFYPYVADPLTNSVSHACPRFHQSVFSAPSQHTAPVTSHLALELGDFTRLAMNPAWSSAYDCVVTCFFIDTAVNVLDYMWAIHRVLKPGGVWINAGPLHYHHPVKKGAVHLSLEGLLEGARMMGLKPEGVNGGQEKGSILEECPYRPELEDCPGLRIERYRPVLFRARKAL